MTESQGDIEKTLGLGEHRRAQFRWFVYARDDLHAAHRKPKASKLIAKSASKAGPRSRSLKEGLTGRLLSITPKLPDKIRQGNVFTWVDSQWKF